MFLFGFYLNQFALGVFLYSFMQTYLLVPLVVCYTGRIWGDKSTSDLWFIDLWGINLLLIWDNNLYLVCVNWGKTELYGRVNRTVTNQSFEFLSVPLAVVSHFEGSSHCILAFSSFYEYITNDPWLLQIFSHNNHCNKCEIAKISSLLLFIYHHCQICTCQIKLSYFSLRAMVQWIFFIA